MWYLIVSIPDLCNLTYFHYFYLVSVAEKAGFWYDLIGNPEDRFCRIDAHLCIYIHVNADPIHKPVSCDMHIENV